MKPHHAIADYFGYKLVKKRKIDQPIEQHLIDLFTRLAINCVIDVGANIGRYGALLRGAGYRGRIVSFEPAAESFSELELARGGDIAWITMQLGLGSKTQSKVLNKMSSSAFSSFFPPNNYGAERFKTVIEVCGTEKVSVTTLSKIWPDIVVGIPEPRVFLKLDTQGFDLEIFRGAHEVLPHVFGLQSEISLKPIYEGMPDMVETLSVFRDHGYEITGFFPLTRDKKSLAIIECDCIMQRGIE